MSQRSQKVFDRLDSTPSEIHQALRAFSANAAAFTMTKEETLEKYRNKWIAIYKGNVSAVADTLEELSAKIAKQNIPSSEALFRHINPKDKVFIL
jgi:Family of unknown function (DUF5678)